MHASTPKTSDATARALVRGASVEELIPPSLAPGAAVGGR